MRIIEWQTSRDPHARIIAQGAVSLSLARRIFNADLPPASSNVAWNIHESEFR
jgi:hypothetical protein